MREQSGRTFKAVTGSVTLAVAVVAAGAWQALPATTPATIVRGWGTNSDGALGTGSGALNGLTPARVKVPKGVSITSIRAGADHSLAVTSTGRVLAWGDNTEGQVGDGTTKTRKVPVFVKLPKGAKVTAVRAGSDHSLARTSGGAVLSWGLNRYGQLGDGTTKDRHAPVMVKLPAGTKVKAISAGCHDSFALTTTGKLYAWGRNLEGELGDGTHKNRKNPVLVKLPAGTTVTTVTAGCWHTFALTTSGLFGWGLNTDGQLGNGDMRNTDTPARITFLVLGPGPGRLTSLFAGCDHTIALFSKGGVMAWGLNNAGQLGNGSSMPISDKPVSVTLPAGIKVKSISAGCDNSYLLTTTGKVYAWGLNSNGELGVGSLPADSNVPVLVHLPASPGATAIGSGPAALHAFAIAP